MKKNIFYFLIFFTLCCIGKEPAFGVDHIQNLSKDLSSTEVEFDSFAVETTIKSAFENSSIYNIKKAKDAYNSLVKPKNGKVLVDDLFYVCLNAYKTQPTTPEAKKEAWKNCKKNFIEPLIRVAKVNSFINDALATEVYNNEVGGDCTPPEYDSTISNMLCDNIGIKHTPAFEKVFITKMRTEGGCTDIGSDGCDRTCYGVCSSTKVIDEEMNKIREKLQQDYLCRINTFTRANAKEYAWRLFKLHRLDEMPDSISGDVFLGLWGAGKSEIIEKLQEILGVTKTGRIDNQTIAAAKAYKGNLRKRFIQERWKYMTGTSNYSGNANGWAKGFIKYIKNGCHTQTQQPLTKMNAEPCILREKTIGYFNSALPVFKECNPVDAEQKDAIQARDTRKKIETQTKNAKKKLEEQTKQTSIQYNDNTRVTGPLDKTSIPYRK